MIRVSVGTYPGGEIKDYALGAHETVRDALAKAGINVGNDAEVRVDGELVSMNSPLSEGDLVIVSKKVKGN